MAKIEIDLDNLKNDDDTFNGADVEALQRATGKDWPDLVKEIEAQESESIDKYLNKPLSKMKVSEKTDLIAKIGNEKYRELVRMQNRKG